MNFQKRFFGPQRFSRADLDYQGSTFSEVYKALFANSYYLKWGGPGEPPLPVYETSLGRVLAGAWPRGYPYAFKRASERAIQSRADLRWGPDRRGFRRLLHPNGVCLVGDWIIDKAAAATDYSGHFAPGSRALIVARYSSCCTETRRGRNRSLSMVGKLFPTTDPDHTGKLVTANFITQEDLGGSRSTDISQLELRNAPDVTPWRRGAGFPVFLVTGLVFATVDKEPTIRQLYEIAELGKPAGVATRAPEFMRLLAEPPATPVEGEDLDFRDEVLARIYDRGNDKPQRTLTFHIEVSDTGSRRGLLVQRRTISDWKPIGRIVFKEAVASYNGDFVVHFHHAPWRRDRNDPSTVVRRPRRV